MGLWRTAVFFHPDADEGGVEEGEGEGEEVDLERIGRASPGEDNFRRKYENSNCISG